MDEMIEAARAIEIAGMILLPGVRRVASMGRKVVSITIWMMWTISYRIKELRKSL